jgi:transcriptional regulator with XRE-family HTH domain
MGNLCYDVKIDNRLEGRRMSLLGDRLREFRVNRNLTLKQVSDETGLSVSFLSLVERDKVSISVDNLERLAHFYHVRLVHLFQGVEDSSVLITRRSSDGHPSNNGQHDHSAISLLSFRTGARMEPVLVQIGPGKGDMDFRTHDGDVLLFMVNGQVRICSEKGEIHEISTGDSAYYYGFPGRRIENASSENPALLLMVTVPPTTIRDDVLEGRKGLFIQNELVRST